MTSASEDNRFAPPQAHVEVVGASAAGTLAERGSRLGAALIDVVIALLVFGVAALVTPLNIFKIPAGNDITSTLLLNLALGFLFFIAVHGYLLATRGQTVGKLLLKIRIVRSDGSRASFARLAGLRYLTTSIITAIPVVGSFYGLADALFIFRASRKCLHDNIADTIVVKA